MHRIQEISQGKTARQTAKENAIERDERLVGLGMKEDRWKI